MSKNYNKSLSAIHFHLFVVVSFVFLIGLCAGKKDNIHRTVLWEKGTGKYNNYRIPSIIVTQKGTLLAFCEGREGGDAGNIDLLLKRSEDGGKTWGKEQVIWDDKENTCGNPCPVVDKKDRANFVVFNLEQRRRQRNKNYPKNFVFTADALPFLFRR